MRTITVRGTAQIKAKPDQVRLGFRIRSDAEDYAAASGATDSRASALAKRLDDAGFGHDELRLSRYDVEAVYENKHDPATDTWKNVFAGYACTQELVLCFPLDMDRLAMALEAVDASGVEPEVSIQFQVRDEGNVKDDLLAQAAKTARKRAEALCAATGVELGRLLRIKYDWQAADLVSSTRWALNKPGAGSKLLSASTAASLAPEDITIEDSASFVWEIL